MEIKIAQGFDYQGNDWWKWWVWIDGKQSDLDAIDRVIYTLHPTFPNPVREVDNRSTNFRLETAGWGVFRIFARVIKKNGEEIKLKHDLVLKYPDGKKTNA